MTCGICGEVLPDTGGEKMACSTCEQATDVHAQCKREAEASGLRVGCSKHPATRLPVLPPVEKDETPSSLPAPLSASTGRERVERLKTEAEQMKALKPGPPSLATKPSGGTKALGHRPMSRASPSATIPLHRGPSSMPMAEMAPWAKPSAAAASVKPAVTLKKSGKLSAMLAASAQAAERHAPAKVVDYTRLDRLHDAWNAFSMPSCAGSRACACKRCLTMDVLTMTHVIEAAHFESQLAALVRDISTLDGPWALASLKPGKSNYWLCGWLLRCLPKDPKYLPVRLYLTSVNDTRPGAPYDWTEFAEGDTEPKHVVVLDDVSYSGTQFINLLQRVRTHAPSEAIVHACPLFLTPHANRALGAVCKGSTMAWASRAALLSNDALFATLGAHRESNAKDFTHLCQLYAFNAAWGDARALSEGKTLTTFVPFYKIPDYYSCPELAYVTPPGDWLKNEAIARFTFTRDEQSPAYKRAEQDASVRELLP
jgi:hypothetical protein